MAFYPKLDPKSFTFLTKLSIIDSFLAYYDQQMSFSARNSQEKLTAVKIFQKNISGSLQCTFFEGYGGTSDGLQNNFMHLWAKNPRNRSRYMCSYSMKKSGFFDNLSALQKSLLCDHPLTIHMDFPKKIDGMKQNSLHK